MISNNKQMLNFPKEYRVPEFELTKTFQGLRGTCVAFSVVALLNYLQRKQCTRFSPQFLYTQCKREDHNTSDGTGIENAFNCVRKYGVCQEKAWLYDANEDATYIDENMLSKLHAESFADVNFQMLLSPRNVDEYKKILSGAAGNIPMPIVFGCSIFTSSGCRNNWLQEPLPGDNSEEGHAVLLYGWKDTPGLRSRGYFLAQNSLRTNGDNGSGELRIPFEYIEKYGLSAGTVICEEPSPETTYQAESVIVVPEEASNSHCKIMQMGCRKAEISAIESNFFSTIRENIQKAPYFYPELHMPFFKSSQINQVDVKNVLSTEENCTNAFKQWLLDNNITIAKNISVVLYWFKINSRSCWCLTCAFFAAQQGESVTQDDINALQRYIEISCGCRPDTQHFFFTFGTNTKFSSACNVSAVPTVLLCEYRENNLWTHKVPMFERGQVGDEFLVHIMPGQYKEKIEGIMYGWQIQDGHMREQEILTRLGFTSETLDMPTVRMALDDIFAKGGCAKKKSGEIIPYKLWGYLPPDAKKCYRYTTPIKKLKIIQQVLSWLSWIFLLLSLIPCSFVLGSVFRSLCIHIEDKNCSWYQEIELSVKHVQNLSLWILAVIVAAVAGLVLKIIREILYRLKFKYNIG